MEKQNTGGIGFFGLLTIVLITLKLIDIINWSWWLVLLPMIVVHVVGFAGAVIIVAIKYKKEKEGMNAMQTDESLTVTMSMDRYNRLLGMQIPHEVDEHDNKIDVHVSVNEIVQLLSKEYESGEPTEVYTDYYTTNQTKEVTVIIDD